ncbi:MAG: hypothetical protein H6Q85_1333 [candidate division NC10 bacterium]|nr:hypothetical protein [candidate division NC10 bacterium]
MKESARYVKIVEWSEEGQCYVGSSPGLLYGGCHGDDEKQVFDELRQIVEETITLCRKDNKALPPPTSGCDFANRMQHVAKPTAEPGAIRLAPAGPARTLRPALAKSRGYMLYGVRYRISAEGR